LRHTDGAHRASRLRRGAGAFILAAALLGIAGTSTASAAAAVKVVIVAGPNGSNTANNIASAQALAAQARGYGATVVEVYSPNATWERVHAAAPGANIFIYLGHGSGWPSPYKPFNVLTKDGMGLNATLNHGNLNVKYYGEAYIKYLHLAPNSAVLLRGLCYSAGNSEPGKPLPSVTVGKQRVMNYAAGFLKYGARAVFAEPYGSVGYIIDAIFTSDATVRSIFTNGGGWGQFSSGSLITSEFQSVRNTWATAISQRQADGHFRRSVVGNLNLSAAAIR
jgi:hypothetical protein